MSHTAETAPPFSEIPDRGFYVLKFEEAGSVKIIYCGDVVGRSGREAVLNNLEKLRENYKPDVIVVNVENAAHGFGVTPGICRDF